MTNIKGNGPEAGNVHKDETDAPGQNKEITIIVNARPKSFIGKKISFEEVVKLAFGTYETNPNIIYTVTFTRGTAGNNEGEMDAGESIPVKDGMEFTVTKTDKS